MKPAIEIAWQNFGLGIGVDQFLSECTVLQKTNPDIRCLNHPHNFYVQALALSGLLGLLFFCGFYISIVKYLYQQGEGLATENIG